MHPFSTPLKTLENLTVFWCFHLMVFWCFQGIKKGCIGNKCVNKIFSTSSVASLWSPHVLIQAPSSLSYFLHLWQTLVNGLLFRLTAPTILRAIENSRYNWHYLLLEKFLVFHWQNNCSKVKKQTQSANTSSKPKWNTLDLPQ